jgi:hypothetical protein
MPHTKRNDGDFQTRRVGVNNGRRGDDHNSAGSVFRQPGKPPQLAINARTPGSLTDPGPQNRTLSSQFPSAQSPPATAAGDMPMFGHRLTTRRGGFRTAAGAPGHTRRLCNFREHLWRQHAADCGRCSGAALAPQLSRPMGLLATAGSLFSTSRVRLCCGRDKGRPLVFPTRPITFVARSRPRWKRSTIVTSTQGKVPGNLVADQAAVSANDVPPRPFTFSSPR